MFAALSQRFSSLPKLSKTCYLLLLFSFLECAAGAWRSAYSLGLIVGPSLSGLLMESYSYQACWILAGVLGFGLFILFFSRLGSV